MITKGESLGLQDGIQTGHLLAFACAIIWAGYSVLSRRFGKVSTDVVAGFCMVTAILSLICHIAVRTDGLARRHRRSGWQSSGLGLLPVGAAFYTWDYGVKHGDIMVLGASSYASPVLSTLILVATGFADLHWSVIVACLLITVGAVVAAKDMLFPRTRRIT